MRYVYLASAVALAASTVFAASIPQSLSVVNYQFVGEQRVSLTQSKVTYRADLVNPGSALALVTAAVASSVKTVQPVAGQSFLHFGPVPAQGQVTSMDTFTILVDRSAPFDFASLSWSFQLDTPVANAGPNQSARPGQMVTLNGSGSTNPSGVGTLTYAWSVASRPPSSTAMVVNPSNVIAQFTPDLAGNYVIALTVSNGLSSDTTSVTVSTNGTPPVANAGPNQTVTAGAAVTLNGSASTSVDGRPLSYAWALMTRPAGSSAVLSGASSVAASFVADKPGTYMAGLVVNDGMASTPSTVTISTLPVRPVANAGSNQVVNINTQVQLNGAGSTDANGYPLTYRWSLITLPAGSTAALNDTAAVKPVFTDDRPGTYVAQLIVNNGTLDSLPATVTITTNPALAPTANAGANQTITQNQMVTLHGSGTDPQGLPLSYQWALINKPSASAAVLTGATSQTPVFTADLTGTYIAQLIVSNGYVSSAPATVTISTNCTAPTSNPGANQNVPIGATVTLDGSASADACRDPLSYSWSFISRPAGSTAVLSNASAVSPTFVADLGGVYVAQLIVNNGTSASTPATVTITAQGLSFAPATLNVTSAPGALTLTLSAPAGAGGLNVTLASSNTNIATVPASVTIPQGAASAQVMVSPALTNGNATITAQAAGWSSASAAVTVTGSTMTMTLDVATLGLARTMNGTITLAAPAPAGGVSVALAAAPGGVVSVPTQVLIAAGSTSATFTITGSATGSATITGSAPGYGSTSASVNVVIFGSITLPSNTVVGLGQSAPFAVSLPVAAPAGGVTVTLTSSDTSRVTITPATVFIAAGAKTPATQPQVHGANIGSANITAAADSFNSATQAVKVTASLSFSPTTLTINGATTQNLTLTLSAPAPAGGLTVNLSSASPAVATVPATVTYPANATTVSVPVTGMAQGSAVIHASLLPNIDDTTATVTVVSGIVMPASIRVAPGQSVPFQVTLASPAPANGVFLTLSANDASVSVTPANIFIPQGATSPNAAPKVNGLAFGTATVLATPDMPNASYLAASMQVQVTASLRFYPLSLTLQAGAAQQGLALSLTAPDGSAAPAPAGGLTLNVSSDSPSVASAPATVTFAQGSSSVTVMVSPLGVGTTAIHASLMPYVSETTANVTVVGPGSITASAMSVALGQSLPFAITLGTPAPAGGVTVSLATSDAAKVTLSAATVTIAEGQMQPAAQPQVTGTGVGSANITVSAPGYNPATAAVTVTAPALSFAGPITVNAQTPGPLAQVSGNLTLNLTNGQAPAGGLTVTLSSDAPGVASVPATVTIPAGQTTIPVPVTGGSVSVQQTATITASANGKTATAVVTVNPIGGIQISNATVGTNQAVSMTITLPGTAPSSAVTVNLTSSDTNIATVPASVTVAAGSSTASVTLTGVAGGSATITAAAAGYSSGTATATVTPLAMAFSPASLNLNSASSGSFTLNLTGGQAPTAGLTVTLSSDAGSIASVPASVSFAANATSVTVPVTAGSVAASQTTSIHASVGALTAAAQVTVAPLPAITLTSGSLGLGMSGSYQISIAQAAAADLQITLTSADPGKVTVPASVTIPAGSTSASVTGVNAVGIGSSAVTASASGYASGSATITVTAPTPAFTPLSITVNPLATGTLTLNLTGGQAPAAGLVMNLTSSAPAVATVPATVTFAAGATSATVTVTGVAGGAAQITATGAGFTSSATATVNVPGQIALNNPTMGLGMTASLTVTLSMAAPAGGVTVSFTSSDAAKVAAPASLTIAAGATTGSATLTGLAVGSATLTASAAGYLPANATATVTAPALSFAGSPLSIPAGSNGTLMLNLTGGQAPAGGLSVTLASSNAAVASVPANVSIAAGAASANVTVTGVAAGGPVTITATLGSATATAQVSVTAVSSCAAAGSITMQPVNVGQNLQVLSGVAISPAAPAGDLNFNVTSLDPSKLLIAGQSSGAGSQQISFKATQGQSSLTGIYLQGLASSGTVQVQFSGPGYCGQATVTLTPSGFLLSGPGGVSSFTTPAGGSASTLTVSAVRLDSSLAVQSDVAQVRGGASIPVTLANSNSAVGSVTPSVTFTGGVSSMAATFAPSLTTGSTVLSASAAGFSTPATGSTVSVLVQPMGLSCESVSVGKYMESAASCQLQGAVPSSPVSVVITSNDPSKVLLSKTTTGVGTASITLTTVCLQGICQSATPNFYVYGLAAAGSVTYTATASGYGAGTGTVTLTPSGFVLAGPGGIGQSFTAFPGTTKTLTVYAAQLDTAGGLIATTTLAPVTASPVIAINNDNASGGSVSPTSVTMTAGSSAASAVFTAGMPTTSQTVNLTVSTPAGFTVPAAAAGTVSGSVLGLTAPLRLTCDQVLVGQNLQETCTVRTAASASAIVVTLTSNSPNLLLSTSATTAGSNSIQVTILAGNQTATYYVQSLANSGTATHTASAAGYSNVTGTILLQPAGVVISGQYGMGPWQNFFSTTVGTPRTLPVYTAVLNSDNTYSGVQPLRGGYGPLSIVATSSATGVGTVTSPLSISGGSSQAVLTFTPAGTGSVTVAVTQPAGFTAPVSFPLNSYTTLSGTVN